jgi:putative hydrolase of HD superfamily
MNKNSKKIINNKNIEFITENLIDLQRAYAGVSRLIITEERYHKLIKSGLIKEYDDGLESIREPLIEHVGHLPIIASYLHPLIEHSSEVDLGRALIMLSVHDIGETKVGDVLTFSKIAAQVDLETEVARSLLTDPLYEYFEEMEREETLDAKFAKAVDSLAPLLHEVTLFETTSGKHKHHHLDATMIINNKKSHLEWDNVLIEIFEHLIEKYKRW